MKSTRPPWCARAEVTLRQLNGDLERRVEERTELLDAVLGSIDVGIVACGADGALTLFNRTARDFHGLPPGPIDPSRWAEHYDLFEADGATPMQQPDIPESRAVISIVYGRSLRLPCCAPSVAKRSGTRQ